MNEQALKDSYELFKQKGYTKSFDEYVNLINTNPDALNDSYTLFKEKGYGKSIEDFICSLCICKSSSTSIGNLLIFRVSLDTVSINE